MMPSHSVESVSRAHNSSSCTPAWDGVVGRNTPQNAESQINNTNSTTSHNNNSTNTNNNNNNNNSTNSNNNSSNNNNNNNDNNNVNNNTSNNTVSSTPRRVIAATRSVRSPIVTTHQPYRGLPLCVFGVDSELQSYADHSENSVTVKPSYKTGIQRMRPSSAQSFAAAAAASISSLRSSQRSPITAFDGNNDVHVGGDLAAPSSSSMLSAPLHNNNNINNNINSNNSGMLGVNVGNSASRVIRSSASKRMVSLDTAEHYAHFNNLNNNINNNQHHHQHVNNNNNNNSGHVMHTMLHAGSSAPSHMGSGNNNYLNHSSLVNTNSHSISSVNGNSHAAATGAPNTNTTNTNTTNTTNTIIINAGQDRNSFTEVQRCPNAFRLVMGEEKHLNYTGVELSADELNIGDTAERARRLQQRRRQMQYGKETSGYANYILAVPHRGDREFRNPMHPLTPRPEHNCSKRTFDRYLNIWRRQLHLWDDYNPENPQVQYIRIGIPTLFQLGLEPVGGGTPEGNQSGLLSFTPIPSSSTTEYKINAGTACTPVPVRQIRRDNLMSNAATVGIMNNNNNINNNNTGMITTMTTTNINTNSNNNNNNNNTAAVVASSSTSIFHRSNNNICFSNGTGTPVTMPHTIRPSSGCGNASWSINNTPHTPYHNAGMSCHGSTHSNGSYPPLLSVLAQPTIYSPIWPDSSRQSSPNPHSGKRGSAYYPITGNNNNNNNAGNNNNNNAGNINVAAAAAAAASNNNNNNNAMTSNSACNTYSGHTNMNANGNVAGFAAAAAAAANNNNNNNNNNGGTYWDNSNNNNTTGSGGIGANTNNNNNYYYYGNTTSSSSAAGAYGYRGYGSPYGGHRYTPHATPGHHYQNYYPNNNNHNNNNNNNGSGASVTVGNAAVSNGGLMGSAAVCVGHEPWRSPNRQNQ